MKPQKYIPQLAPKKRFLEDEKAKRHHADLVAEDHTHRTMEAALAQWMLGVDPRDATVGPQLNAIKRFVDIWLNLAEVATPLPDSNPQHLKDNPDQYANTPFEQLARAEAARKRAGHAG